MPSVSKAQNAAMHAAAEGHSTLGIPQSVGQEFVNAQTPGSVKRLPQHVGAAKTAHPKMPMNVPRKPFGSFAP